MGDHLKVHPVVEPDTKPTAPLVPNISSKSSELGDPQPHRNSHAPPILPRTIPVIHSRPPKKRSSCCKCICWTISILILLIIILAATVGALYLIFRPKVPKYSVNGLQISDLRLNLDMSLYAKFDVKITAVNPNRKIGIYYEKGSHISVWYRTTNLCQGSLPIFYQGHQNKTVLDVALTGQNQYGQTLLSAIQEQQQTGQIPLDLKIDVPVRIKLGKLKLRKIRVKGKCLLIVDTLNANSKVTIKASNCKFGPKL
jgi:hypothetical protein